MSDLWVFLLAKSVGKRLQLGFTLAPRVQGAGEKGQ